MGRYDLYTLWNKGLKAEKCMLIGIDVRRLEWSRGGETRYLVNMLQLFPKMTAQQIFLFNYRTKIAENRF